MYKLLPLLLTLPNVNDVYDNVLFESSIVLEGDDILLLRNEDDILLPLFVVVGGVKDCERESSKLLLILPLFP